MQLSKLKVIGLSMVFVGFVWLVSQEMNYMHNLHLAGNFQIERLNKDEKDIFNKSEVHSYIETTIVSAYKRRPTMIVPGLIMLAGCLLLLKNKSTKVSPHESA